MNTSYFAKYKNTNGDAVSIALSTPFWYGKNKGWPKIKTYSTLFPTWNMIREYKNSNAKNREQIYIEAYYKEILSKLNPQEVYNDLKDKVLLCYEKPNDFCHRRLVAEWLQNNLDVKIEEIQ